MCYGRSDRYGYIMASLCGRDGQIDFDAEIRPCTVKKFFSHKVGILRNGNIEYVEHVFAEVSWPEKHADPGAHQPNISVWDEKKCVLSKKVAYMPVQRIFCKYAWAKRQGGRVYVSSIPAKVYI